MRLTTPENPPPAPGYIYWTEDTRNTTHLNKITRANLDGSGVTTVYTVSESTDGFGGLAFDAANGHIYCGGRHSLFRINLDGSGRVDLVPTIGACGVGDVELDLEHQKVYFSDVCNNNSIRRSNLDGSNPEFLLNVGFSGLIEGIALDIPAGKVYFQYNRNDANDTIKVMNFDGSSLALFQDLGSNLANPHDVEIDPANRILYWNQITSATVYKADLNNPSAPPVPVFTFPGGLANGFHFDPQAQKIYAHNGHDIFRVNADGTGLTTLVSGRDVINYIEVVRTISPDCSGDTTPPAPNLSSLPDATGQCAATITTAPTATDNCAGTITGTTPDSLTRTAQGTSIVTWTFDDGHGNTSTQTQNIVVQDQTPPVIASPASLTVNSDPGQCSAVVSYSLPMATDNCGEVSVVCAPPSGSSFPAGTTTVTCTAIDTSGNSANSSFQVSVAQPVSIASNFNGSGIGAGKWIWFNSVLKPAGVGSTPVTIRFFAQHLSSANFTLDVPDAIVTFDPAVTTATTTFEGGQWLTRAPASGLSGNTFLSGLNYAVPSTLPGGINPVTWSGAFVCDTPGVTLQWKWAAAVYTTFNTDPNALGVKPVDGNKDNLYPNSDHAGTPENYKSFVTGGARGGGGSNFTGGYSGTASVSPCAGH